MKLLKMAVQLGSWDYVVFTVTILLTTCIAVFRIYKDQFKNSRLEHLLFAKRSSGIFPIVMSSVATLMSGITLIATPAEAYVAGVSNIHFCLGIVISMWVVTYVYLPVYYKLNVTSVMEYVELRFNRVLRLVAAGCYFLSQLMFSAIILQLPALALNRVSGIGIWESMAPTAIICTLYTALGGFNAVIWTDVLQAFLMFATIILVMTKGLIEIGGFGVLWDRMSLGQRTTFAYWTPEPTVRFTIWASYTGSLTIHLIVLTEQTMVQRQLASKTMKSAQMSVYATSVVNVLCNIASNLLGWIMYARYFDCDPVSSGQIASRDQLVPHFAMEILRNFPGLGGFFVGGIVAATLSTLSSNINSLALIAMQDFVKPFFGNISNENATKLSKIFATAIGLTILACVLIVQNFASAVEAINAVKGITTGQLLGLTTLGILVPFASNLGTAVGCVTGALLSLWVVLGASFSNYVHPYLPLETYGCNETLGYNYTFPTSNSSTPYLEHNASVFPLYTMSFFMYVFVSFAPTVVVGIIVSLVTGPQCLEDLPQGVVHPGIVKIFKMLPRSLRSKLGSKSNNTNTPLPEEEMIDVNKE